MMLVGLIWVRNPYGMLNIMLVLPAPHPVRGHWDEPFGVRRNQHSTSLTDILPNVREVLIH
jgi:hypothetical protein